MQVTENGYVSKDSIFIIKKEIPALDLGKDTFLCGDFNILLNPGNWKSYHWLPDNSTQKELLVNKFGRYAVTVFTADGCEASDTININEQCEPQLWVPNVFTPFNDDINNIFKPVSHDVTAYEMRIYNRWGELLFVTKDLDIGWNGTFKGEQCQMEAYLWTIKYSGYHTNKYIYGTVTLLR